MQACWACSVAYVQADIDKPNHLPGVRSKLERPAILNLRKRPKCLSNSDSNGTARLQSKFNMDHGKF